MCTGIHKNIDDICDHVKDYIMYKCCVIETCYRQ